MKVANGYTLIEVLIASTIFVSVLLIGMSSFSTVNRLSEQVDAIETTAETSYFLADTVARELRSAAAVQLGGDGSLLFQTSDPVSGKRKERRFATGPFVGEDRFLSCQDRPCFSAFLDDRALLPATFAVERFEFAPFIFSPPTVRVSFVLLNLSVLPEDPYFRTEYQAAVVSRATRR